MKLQQQIGTSGVTAGVGLGAGTTVVTANVWIFVVTVLVAVFLWVVRLAFLCWVVSDPDRPARLAMAERGVPPPACTEEKVD